jgi:VanZ family protein
MLSFGKQKYSHKVATIVVVVLLLVTLVFIWGNSLRSEKASGAESGCVLQMIQPFLESFLGKGIITDHLVRKLAHFTEFGALGAELALLVVLRGRPRAQALINGLAGGLAAAVTDEALQLLSGRGSMVQDVLLDFSGVVAGGAVLLAVYAASVVLRNRKTTGRR